MSTKIDLNLKVVASKMCKPKSPTPNPKIPSTPVMIDKIQTQEELWDILDNGGIVTAYRGFHHQQNQVPGQEWAQTYAEGLKQLRNANPRKMKTKDQAEALAEETRMENFPNCPARLTSIFVAATASGAKEYGTVHLVDLCLKQGAKAAQAIRWLNIEAWNQFAQQHGTEELRALTKNMIGELDFEAEEREEPTARELAIEYFRSRGEDNRWFSELLINPALATVTVGEEQTNIKSFFEDFD